MSALALWGMVKAGAGWVFDLLRRVPWQAWLALAILFIGWRWGEHRFDAGITKERERWEQAQKDADEKVKGKTEKRDKAATTINTDTARSAASKAAETRAETAAASERVRYVYRTIEVPAGCPVALPDGVQQELARAAKRTAAAGDPLRAGDNPRP